MNAHKIEYMFIFDLGKWACYEVLNNGELKKNKQIEYKFIPVRGAVYFFDEAHERPPYLDTCI